MGPIRILIADDHAIIRSGLRAVLGQNPGFEIVAEAADGREALELAERTQPTVAILDISMPYLNGLEVARRILSKRHDVQVVMLTVHAHESYLIGALKAGARGYVLKTSAELEVLEAVRAVTHGKAYFSPTVSRILADDYMRFLQAQDVEDPFELLTSRERQILQLLAEGQSNKDIANLLYLSPTTVICHRQHIFQKLNFHSLVDLILYAIRRGIIVSQQEYTA
jgi:two-component system, NarL family, response regulator NreC